MKSYFNPKEFFEETNGLDYFVQYVPLSKGGYSHEGKESKRFPSCRADPKD